MPRQYPPGCVYLAASRADVLRNFGPEAMQPVLLFVIYSPDALLPTGAVNLRGDREGLAIGRETPYATAFSRDIFHQYPLSAG